ncbi:hypothetical protein FRC01_003523 [Tulasnella sp. 417]|nr:hypothetical protein FRC01_003523 [Tulasnella sp. 417]
MRINFRDGLSKPNWDLWSYYAKRVRSLEIFDIDARGELDSLIDPEITIYLLSSFIECGGPGKRLIPNIKRLSLQFCFPSTPSLALLFTTPSLKSLEFFALDPSIEVLRSVRKVLTSLNAMRDVVQIQKFTIYYDEPHGSRAEFERVLIDFLGSQPTISNLAFGLLGGRTPLATILKAIPSLKVLELSGSFSASEEELRAGTQIIADNAKDLEDFNYFGLREDMTIGSVLFSIPIPLFQCSNLKILALGNYGEVLATHGILAVAIQWRFAGRSGHRSRRPDTFCGRILVYSAES